MVVSMKSLDQDSLQDMSGVSLSQMMRIVGQLDSNGAEIRICFSSHRNDRPFEAWVYLCGATFAGGYGDTPEYAIQTAVAKALRRSMK